ncbi:YpmA family protein [Clostridium sp. UBA4548]|uniref:YpmA family protein n=1 Tax=Clostridium sp. UBA4548 TaxID=1946361 RepID=UPI0025C7316F|nr:YpmA family protein [Clostridium sp. UBA4548]
MKDKLQLIATKEFKEYDEMYKIVDFLNKNLSGLNLIFGMHEKNNSHVLSIYKEES